MEVTDGTSCKDMVQNSIMGLGNKRVQSEKEDDDDPLEKRFLEATPPPPGI